MKKILNAFSIVFFIGILAFLWDSWNRARIDDQIEKDLKFEVLNEIKNRDPKPQIRARLLKTVFANLDLNDSKNIFFKSSFEEFSDDLVISNGRFSSPQTGFKCVHLIFANDAGTLILDKKASSFSNKGLNCFNDMELVARATVPYSAEGTTDDLTIETENWISPTQLKVEGYIVKDSIYQYSLTVFRDNFELKTKDVSVKKLPY